MAHKKDNSVMEFEDTICYKVKECLDEINEAVKTGSFNAGRTAELLHSIQSDAVSMEEALKANKVLRNKYGYDKEYREMMKEKFTPPGVNKIVGQDYEIPDTPRFVLKIWNDKNELIYDNKLFGFIMCAVERITNIDEAGMIDGQTQCFAVGHDLAVFYAFDQLKQKFAARFTQIMLKMSTAINKKTFRDPVERQKFINAANGILSK